MARRWLRLVAYSVLGVVSVLFVTAAGVYGYSEMRFRKRYDASVPAPAVSRDGAVIARGSHLVRSFAGCVECHGENLAGKVVVDDPAIGTLYSANLTRGAGGVGASRSDADLARAIRHGVGANGRSLLAMPSDDYADLSHDDLAAIIAYVRSIPPVDDVHPARRVGPVARAMLAAGKMPIISAERVDHDHRVPAPVAPAATAEYGRYVVSVGCKGCHGPNLSGGPIAGAPPSYPQAANLTPAGRTTSWTEADFLKFFRTGIRPDGIPVNPVMPINLTKNLTDDEIRAIVLYLRTLPAAPTGQRETS